MEVTKRYPLVNMYQGPGDIRCYNSLTRTSTSHSWFEWLNRIRQNKKPEMSTQVCLLERAYLSVIPKQNVLSTPEESVVHYCPTKMPRYNSWKSNFEHLKLPLTFPAVPDSRVAIENKSFGLLSTSLVREITQKLFSICHLQHFCDLVSGLVNTVSAPHSALMALRNTPNVECVSECENINNSSVEHQNLVSGFCESVNIHCSATNQGDPQKTVSVVNDAILDMTEMSEVANSQKNTLEVESIVPLLCENMMQVEVENCSTQCQDSDYTSVDMKNDVCHNSPAGEIRAGTKNKLKNVDEEMVTRKQRRINKHSKKRKRRMRKKEKMSSGRSCVKGRTSTKKEVPSSISSQVKSRSGLSESTRSTTVFHDWEDSDDDFCIVFDDEDDSHCDIVPENVNARSTIIKEGADLWLEFDSLTIVSGNSSASMDYRSYSSEISIQYDSESDVEYETDSGQIFVDTDDFDSLSGLVFLSDGAGCSTLPGVPYASCQSFTSSTTSYELVNDCVGIYEVNKRWREVTSRIDGKPRLPQRVTFAPEEDLVAVFPVDMMDRKSEWEQFALERFRFKRRIDEFEKIIAPYLTCAHREKIFKRLTDTAS